MKQRPASESLFDGYNKLRNEDQNKLKEAIGKI